MNSEILAMRDSSQIQLRNLSPRQIEAVREALTAVRERGGTHVGGAELTWKELAEEVSDLTRKVQAGTVQRTISRLVSSDGAEFHNAGRSLQRFGEGEPIGSGKYPLPREPLASDMLEFLFHPKVRALSFQALEQVDVSYFTARSFAEFFRQQSPQPDDVYAGLSGTYFNSYIEDGRRFIRTIEFHESGHPFFAFLRESCFNVERRRRVARRNGWATFSMHGEIAAFLVDVGAAIVHSRFGEITNLNVSKNSAQIFFLGIPTVDLDRETLSMSQSYVNENFRINARELDQLRKRWASSDGRNVDAFRYLGDISLSSKNVYDILGPNNKTFSWGSKRFFDASGRDKEVHLSDDNRKEFSSKAADTPELIAALKACDEARFKSLVQEGADVNCREPRTLLTPLHYVAILEREFELEVLRTRDDLDVLVRDHKGHLPSSHAVGLEDSTLFLDLMREEIREARRRGMPVEELHAHLSRD